MSYIATTMNHIRAMKAWIDAHGGEANLNLGTFELEVRAHHRYFTLFPQFLARVDGRICHVSALTAQVVGFIGWLPYRPVRWALSSDKLMFKQLLAAAGLRAPAMWDRPQQTTSDFIAKPSMGSFGYGLRGPFSPGSAEAETLNLDDAVEPTRGRLYLEQFVSGQNMKAWFWGGQPFHAHLHDYPRLQGDGRQTVSALLQQRLAALDQSLADYPEIASVRDALSHQGASLETILPASQSVWLDFRYGRRFVKEETSEQDDNALPRLATPVLEQLQQVGRFLAAELQREMPAPVLFSLDAVLDDKGRVWWLEMNSNPIFPPTGYPHMLSTLFGVATTKRTQRPAAREAALP
jgi:hypothetical protein